MYKMWPSPILFAVAAWLFFHGQEQQNKAEKFLADHPVGSHIGEPGFIPFYDRDKAKIEISTGFYMQIGSGILVLVGVVLIGLGLIHRRIQTQALKHRLAVTYTFVSQVPTEGSIPDAGLLNEDQAADLLHTRYPTLAKGATETLRRQFADKRRQEPTRIWYVKDLQVSEAPG